MVKIKDKISAINALHSIPIMPKLRPKIIIAGTKKITSLEMDSKVELIESPQDCRNIVADLTMQVKIIPLKYILKQSLAYSIYELLPDPNNEIIKSGANSKIRKAIVPIIVQIINICFKVSLTRSKLPAP